MKMQADRIDGLNAIARHGPEGVIVNRVEHRRSVLVPWQGDVVDWPVTSIEELSEAHFEAMATMAPELIVLGSGLRIQFVKPALLRPLMARRIGIETMDTAAACRTYNVLLAEGRNVLAALLFSRAA